jgi:hypothetical protein
MTETKGIYTLRKITTKYVTPALIGLAILSSGCKEQKIELPVRQDVKEHIQTYSKEEKERQQKKEEMTKTWRDLRLKTQYQDRVTSIENKLNDAIVDMSFDKEEQKSLLAEYDSLQQKIVEINSYRETIKHTGGSIFFRVDEEDIVDELKMPKEHRLIYDLLKENLKGIDYGQPELEKVLAEQGISVKVETCESNAECVTTLVATPVVLYGLIWCLSWGLPLGLELVKFLDNKRKRGFPTC